MSVKFDLFVEIREDLIARAKKDADNFDVLGFANDWLTRDLGGIASLNEEGATPPEITPTTIHQVVQAAKIYGTIPHGLAFPWKELKEGGAAVDLGTLSAKELKARAKSAGITGFAKMRKEDLVKALAA